MRVYKVPGFPILEWVLNTTPGARLFNAVMWLSLALSDAVNGWACLTMALWIDWDMRRMDKRERQGRPRRPEGA